ncbi:hypothetical protein F0L68_30705 [Solihabitans fulvus]|uniref:Uncharacterized protein n=1 Tax=Solihabitans fulvus TaxID=1892852 RepID=A0A5B2WWI6_9PSEU|nr:hypothetical protein [Solihabitans fulvus]KAA2254297.1 hypothetical protein F0L68_30705 [Solihabitans fulvus]
MTASLSIPQTALAASAHASSPTDCAVRLDCAATDLDTMSMTQRLEFLDALERGPASELSANFDRWSNIRGIVDFFRDHELGAPGSWISYVDAGILEGIERGTAIALGRSTDTFGNPGSVKWATYLIRLKRGELTDRATHDRAWGEAEQASTDRGVAIAGEHGAQASAVDRRFFMFSEFYRWTLRNRPAALNLLTGYGMLIRPEVYRDRVPFLDWFTDVRNPVPARKGAEVAYALARLDPLRGTFTTLDLLLAYLPDLFRQFQLDTGSH